MKKKLAVIGTGTAGILSLSHALAFLNGHEWEVYSLYDPNTPILGIGESTTAAIPFLLGKGANFSMMEDAPFLETTVKYGVRYVDWRPNDVWSRFPVPHYGIHFNNHFLHDFAEQRFKEVWKDKFKVIYCKVTDVIDMKDHAIVKSEHPDYKFDWVIDCRGWPTDYTDYEMSEAIPVNSAAVHVIDEPGDWEYTYHKAMPNGWMFGIPLTSRQGWGYLYNSDVTSLDQIVDDMSKHFKKNKRELNLRTFDFKNYIAKNCITGRVIKNGNRAMFLEPLEALSGFYYSEVMRNMFDVMFFTEFTGQGKSEEQANKDLYTLGKTLEMFNSYVYHGGSIYDTPFWRMAKERANKNLQSEMFETCKRQLNEFYQEDLNVDKFVFTFARKLWYDLDKQFGYNYFKLR